MTRLIYLLVLTFVINLFLQAQSIRFGHLTVEEGLSQNAVTCILQDSKGFMWFGTQDGLNRYDGYNFKIFKNDPSDSNSISDNFISTIYEDKNKNLIFRTISGKLNIYNPLSESFSIVEEDSTDFFSTRYNTVLSFYYDRYGIEWQGGGGRGTGLKRIDSKKGTEKIYNHNPGNTNTISNDRVYSITRDSRDNIWIGTAGGLDKLDESTGKITRYKSNPNVSQGLSDNFVWPVFEDSNGIIWIGTVSGGLNRFDPKTEKFSYYKNEPTDPTSITDNFIFSIYEDSGGVIWVGTNTGGVNYFHPSTQAFEHYKNLPGRMNGLSTNDVRALYVDRDGIYWIGTSDGLEKFDYENNRFKNYTHDPKNPKSIVNNPIQLIYEDKSGILWLGTFNGGLLKFDKNKETFQLYKNEPGNANSLSDDRIYSIFEDKHGVLWIGTYGGGLNKFDRITGKFINYIHDEKDSTSISYNGVWSILEDKNGLFWVGTYGGGINLFNPKTGSFNKKYRQKDNRKKGLNDDRVIKIFEDSKGNIWIGTMSGLNRYDPKTDSFKSYTEKNGLSNNVIFGIVEDENNDLWLSTYNGLSRFNPSSDKFNNYYYQDGLQGNEFNQNAYANDSKIGRLLFGGPNGLNVFNPDSIKINLFIPPVVFTDFRKYNTDDQEGKAIIEKGIAYRNEIVLTYEDNIVSFEFSALSYLNNFKNLYRYKLEGFNENWIQLESNHSVTFTNLSPGEYVLRISGSNNNGLWNNEGSSLIISVKPPWWRTKIAYALYVIAFLSLLYGIRGIEIKRREQKALMRERELLITAAESEKRALKAENERKTQELEDARNMQLSMLPKEIPQTEDLEIAVFMRTATEVGGDYYDFKHDEDGTLSIAFGDATGHGLQAGTMVTLFKGFFASFESNLDIKSFFERCTRIIKEIKLGRIMMAFILMKIKNKKLLFSSAGMPPVYYYNSGNKKVEELMVTGMPLGAMSKIMFFNQIEKQMESGDTIMIFSDGLPEQMNKKGEMYDYPRFIQKFGEIANMRPQEIVDELLFTIDEWKGDAVQEDDISLLVIKTK